MGQKDNSIAAIASRFVNGTGRHIFLTGRAGTGKTTFLKNIVNSTHKKCIVAAPTGIAAINAGGVTLHSLFHLPFGSFVPGSIPFTNHEFTVQLTTPGSLIKGLQMNSVKRNMLREMELLIIDEVSMLRADLLDAIDTILRYLKRERYKPFGGTQILFIGDLLQLPPIIKKDELEYLAPWYKSLYFFEAKALADAPPVFIELDKIYRQTDKSFIEILNNLRDGRLKEENIQVLNRHFKPDILPGSKEGYIYLTTHNHKADSLNRNSLKQLPGKSFFYEALVEGDFGEHLYPVEYQLELKNGAQVMFIKNDYSGEQRYFNGKIGIVTSLSKDEITVRFEDGSFTEVEKYTWENKKYTLNRRTNEIEEKVAGSFIHFPIKLAWAITIHKSQGLTFEKAIIDVGSAFAPGQVYVALSRLTSLKGLVLTSSIPSRGISIDEELRIFTSGKKTPEAMMGIYDEEARRYVFEYVQKAFDFGLLHFQLTNHLASYDKDEKKSAKQRYRNWAVELLKNLNGQKTISDKFINQIKQYNRNNDSGNSISWLHARVISARGYYEQELTGFVTEISKHIHKIKQIPGTKSYIKQLGDLNAFFRNQVKAIEKAQKLIEAAINNRELSRGELHEVDISEYQANKDDKENKSKERPEKPKKGRKPVGYSRELSLQMYREGKTVTEIASERSLAISTVEGHLAVSVKNGQLDVLEFVDESKIQTVVKARDELDTLKIKEIKDFLGETYTYTDVRFVLAFLEYKEGIA